MNAPVIALYKKAGFEISELQFPGWYDWNGGYECEADTAIVAAHLEHSRFSIIEKNCLI